MFFASLVLLVSYLFATVNSLLCICRANDDRLGGASVFVGGFILGGIVVGTLGAIYAPQVCLSYSSRAFFEIILVKLLKVVQVVASGESSKALHNIATIKETLLPEKFCIVWIRTLFSM